MFDALTDIIKTTQDYSNLDEMLTAVCERLFEALPAHNILIMRSRYNKGFEIVASAQPPDHRAEYALNYVREDYVGESFSQDDVWVQAIDTEYALVVISDQVLSKQEKQLLESVTSVLQHVLVKRSISNLIAINVNEMKGFLVPIEGYSDLVRMIGELNEQQSNSLEVIKRNAVYGIEMLGNIRDVTRIFTHEGLRVHLEPTSIESIVTEAIKPHTKQIEEKEQTLTTEIPSDLPLVLADKNRMIQVITNLLSNAVKFTPNGGEIKIRAEAQNDEVIISVADNGIGISQQDQKQLFMPYFRSSNEEAIEKPGAGLGLFISREIIKKHKGRIWVESEVGEGSTFYIALPIA